MRRGDLIRRILPTVFCLLSLTRPAAAASAYTVEEFGELDRGAYSRHSRPQPCRRSDRRLAGFRQTSRACAVERQARRHP